MTKDRLLQVGMLVNELKFSAAAVNNIPHLNVRAHAVSIGVVENK